MPKFTVVGFEFEAEGLIGGVLLNPALPEAFDDTPNEERPEDHQKFWDVPFITTMSAADWEEHFAGLGDERAAAALATWNERDRAKWFDAWPTGTRYDVRCLDGGAWDRSTNWGSFVTPEEAIACAKAGSPHGDMRTLRAKLGGMGGPD